MHEEVTRIELVHSAWIDYERAGDLKHVLALFADDVEFWPRNASPIVGRAECGNQSALVIQATATLVS